jgi:hypothetical protein
MMLCSHLEASSRRDDQDLGHRAGFTTSMCYCFSLFSCQGSWSVTARKLISRYSSVHRRAFRGTPP